MIKEYYDTFIYIDGMPEFTQLSEKEIRKISNTLGYGLFALKKNLGAIFIELFKPWL